MGPAVGIDLGTTNSLVAYLEDGRPKIAPNSAARGPRGRLVVGARAKEELVLAPDRTFAEVKRFMGSAEKVRLGDRQYTPTELSAIVLRALREDAERFFGDAWMDLLGNLHEVVLKKGAAETARFDYRG